MIWPWWLICRRTRCNLRCDRYLTEQLDCRRFICVLRTFILQAHRTQRINRVLKSSPLICLFIMNNNISFVSRIKVLTRNYTQRTIFYLYDSIYFYSFANGWACKCFIMIWYSLVLASRYFIADHRYILRTKTLEKYFFIENLAIETKLF